MRFLPYQPRERAAARRSRRADVHFVGLARGLSGYVVPSRLYGILAAGRPVIVAADADERDGAARRARPAAASSCRRAARSCSPRRSASAHDGELDLDGDGPPRPRICRGGRAPRDRDRPVRVAPRRAARVTERVQEREARPARAQSRRGLLRPLQHLRSNGEGDRFLSRSTTIALTAYGLFALTFASFKVQESEGDGDTYYNLLRRFFGEHPDFAFAYQFGSDVWNAPFFLVGKVLAAVFGYQPPTFHVSIQEISITIATNAAFLVTLYLGWRILRELDLPRGGAVLMLTAFGTPLFYYVVFVRRRVCG